MTIYMGADHRGFDLKEQLKKHLLDSGYDVIDGGNIVEDKSDNYPQFAEAIAREVSGDTMNRKGILVCGSGAGMCIAANKFPGIRASLSFTPDHASAIKEEDDVNILCLAADFLDLETAKKITAVWLQTPFVGEDRYRDRIEDIRQIEIKSGLWK